MLLKITAVYFTLCIAVIIALSFDLPAGFILMGVVLVPLFWMSKPFEVLLSPIGFWQGGGVGGWVNYEGPTEAGFLLVMLLYLVLAWLVQKSVSCYRKKKH